VCGAALLKELWNKRCRNQNNVINLTLKTNQKSNKLEDMQQHDNGFTYKFAKSMLTGVELAT